jgi:hypothetical protein
MFKISMVPMCKAAIVPSFDKNENSFVPIFFRFERFVITERALGWPGVDFTNQFRSKFTNKTQIGSYSN